ncbi:hypothetical protein [Haloarchaeobius sp. FL176]|uniref:hypothetical protein n=1 Tax=Haloarchaeobius sp. FL176 TaxID=2967129 RepID=UPI002147BEC3|nr:hypothetical protein [Haloarchaeobius sp. FL176]
MAHSPERPELYVCGDCQIVYAGTVAEHMESGDHVYESPTECEVCGATDFVENSQWPHHHD